MKMNKKRISGILLSLALMVGLLSGMSMTAYADDPYVGIKNTTTVIHFDNKDWYLIDYDSSTVTLLSKEAVALSKYNYSDTYVEYNNSYVKTVVDNWYNANISAKADTAVDAVSGNKMFLLTTEQAQAIEAVNREVLKCPIYQLENMWWLCSPGNDGPNYKAAQVNGYTGFVVPDGNPVHLFDHLVRPALKLNLSKVIFSSESNTFYPIAAVNLTGGANATTSGGATSQTGLTGAMTTVTYTANTGYQFPATSDLYTTTGGITVDRTGDTVVTVSGTPTDIEVNVTVPDAFAPRVPLSDPDSSYASPEDNFAPVAPGSTNGVGGNIGNLVLDFSNVAGSGVDPSGLQMTAISGSKFSTKGKLKDKSSFSKTGGIKVKVNKNTLIPTISCKKSGSVTLSMEDGNTYTLAFNVQKPKAQKSEKKLSKGSSSVTKTIKQLFGTDIVSGKLKILKEKKSGKPRYPKTTR